MSIQPFTVHVNSDGEITVSMDGIVKFDGKVAHVETLKKQVGWSMWLSIDDRLAINAEIDSKVACWLHWREKRAPVTKPAEATEVVDGPGGCTGWFLASALGSVIWMWVILGWPLAALVATILWVWGAD